MASKVDDEEDQRAGQWRRDDLHIRGDNGSDDGARPMRRQPSRFGARTPTTTSSQGSRGGRAFAGGRGGGTLNRSVRFEPTPGKSVLGSTDRAEPAAVDVNGLTAEYILAEAAASTRAFREPQVHFLGEITGGSGFPDGVTCKWAIEVGAEEESGGWELTEGLDGGQTQTVYSEEGDGFSVWCHPIDVHYSVGSMKGWPRLTVEVWQLDAYGRLELSGYGFAHLPSSPGPHTLEIPTWRPVGSSDQEFAAYYVGGVPRLARSAYVYERRAERHTLVTSGSGTVVVDLNVVARDFATHGVEF